MKQLIDIIKENNLQHQFFQGSFGIEREAVRTDKEGQLALTPHPKKLGSRTYHPYIQTDFSESQPEMITSVKDSVHETYRQLLAIHDVIYRSISEDELLWSNSMPAVLPENEDDIPIIDVEDYSQIAYRELLAQKYGRKVQVISGIHYNFSFQENFIKALYVKSESDKTYIDFKNRLYMHVAEKFMRYRWILTYLMSASPVADSSFYSKGKELNHVVRSVRNSGLGYANVLKEGSAVSYHTVDEYVQDILTLIEDGQLDQSREYYGSVRPRSKGNFEDMPKDGIDYLEIRSLDVNPYSYVGISEDQLHFVHIFISYLLTTEPLTRLECADEVDEVKEGNLMSVNVAKEDPHTQTQYLDEGLEVVEGMENMLIQLGYFGKYQEVMEKTKMLFVHPERTLAARLVDDISTSGNFIDYTLNQSKGHKETAYAAPYQLNGYTNMEMSTQLLMFDAIQKGVEVEVVDEEDQFILLKHGEHEEYVQKANKTTKDNYVSQLVMANKTVTKYALNREGFIVPAGIEVKSIEEGVSQYALLKEKKIVIKPKSTNFGLGITILNENSTQEHLESALKSAFAEDDYVLMEEFIEGTEYRFFVLDGETIAVLLREPAQVVGDGERSIEALIAEKNTHPLRGHDHRKPLEKIEINQILLDTIQSQGYSLNDIPEKDKKIFLRRNSNISTGGESIDFTDKMHDSYKNIAADIAEALEVTITGVDLIIPDYTKASTVSDPGYTCLEANFNPAMHMHQYVAQGKGVRVSLHVLDLLFKELHILDNEIKE